ncbi:phosphatase PAP2 family protein [Pseudodesulfovibrio sp. JC047]|uniref:phosphatase PAP2 family protein n=1 Tax=Pseudodesulfovibrio sp. JC047 TaxID=2683199 RepID=UPI0013D3B6E2|nr:phosphatase PAP2 family protein [Pseudodesulfovibrio sp. JC047]NDV18963.1 phosphatase PAP2 family protein [Pseudodesulfovibrio sp. JC047]
MFFSTLPFDLHLFLLINQQWRLEILDVLMPIFSSMAVLLILLGIAIVFALFKGGKKHGIYFIILFVAMGMADFSTKIIKADVSRVRPLNAIAGTNFVEDGAWQTRPANFIQTKERGTSYPSAHCANTMSLALLAMLLWPALKKWPLLLPLVVGYSRVYLGKHYPTDVMAGWLTGVVVAGLVWLVWESIHRRYFQSHIG